MKKNLQISLLFSFCLFLLSPALTAQTENDGMNNKKMEEIIKREAEAVEGQVGHWQLKYNERLVLVMMDEANNRMRIFTPVVAEKDLLGGELKEMLEANFHSALDAKYSLYENYVITVFTHPLKELTEAQFVDAMQQVANLADNFGTTYSSTSLIFGGGQAEEEKDKRINKKPGGKS